MSHHWMPKLRLPLTLNQFQQLPRHPAYRYEFLGSEALLTPDTRHFHALLTLRPVDRPPSVVIRPMTAADQGPLTQLFAEAFHRTQPFAGLNDHDRLLAAREALERTRTGGDGPWAREASRVAVEGDDLIGAAYVTLLPLGDPTSWEAYYWTSPPPADAIEQRMGRPHLTWIFVHPGRASQGIGSELLAAVGNHLWGMGFPELLSTFVIGNDASMLWHWRNGFRLLSSRRLSH